MSRPSLALFPCAYDTGKLYSVLPDTGAGDFTVSRNGTATYFDKDGVLKTAAANEPRFDFDPLTGLFKGVLVEPSAIRIASIELTSGWTQTNIESLIFSEHIFGIYPTYQIKPNNTLGSHSISRGLFFNPQGVDIDGFFEVFLKPDGYGSASISANFNFPNTINGVNTFAMDISSINNGTFSGTINPNDIVVNEPSTNGFRRIVIKFKLVGSSNTVLSFSIFPNQRANFSGNGNSIIAGAQIQFSPILSSLIVENPTQSQVTRPADIIDVTVPAGITEIKETVNGVENTITSIPTTYQLPNGRIEKIIMR
jgi:hypothetical protein